MQAVREFHRVAPGIEALAYLKPHERIQGGTFYGPLACLMNEFSAMPQ